MSNSFKLVRSIIMWVLIASGIGIFILSQTANGLAESQASITLILWIYLILVFGYIIFLNAIPMALQHYRKK